MAGELTLSERTERIAGDALLVATTELFSLVVSTSF